MDDIVSEDTYKPDITASLREAIKATKPSPRGKVKRAVRVHIELDPLVSAGIWRSCITCNQSFFAEVDECQDCQQLVGVAFSERGGEPDTMPNEQPNATPEMTREEVAIMTVLPTKCNIAIKCAWNPFFINEFKQTISANRRTWNPTDKLWEIHPDEGKRVQVLLKKFYKEVKLIGAPQVGDKVKGTKFERLMVKLAKDDKLALYRLLALKYHPDKGGDHEIMSLINEVFKQ